MAGAADMEVAGLVGISHRIIGPHAFDGRLTIDAHCYLRFLVPRSANASLKVLVQARPISQAGSQPSDVENWRSVG
ncbi:hypothetical protein [Bradyrhizobium oligotrophicum]|uniref:hypothetical protein n=1 Tax=Bradyrhizobium oligotrophicum TaxID=44255 RepID=UPI003EBA1BBD